MITKLYHQLTAVKNEAGIQMLLSRIFPLNAKNGLILYQEKLDLFNS